MLNSTEIDAEQVVVSFDNEGLKLRPIGSNPPSEASPAFSVDF